MGSSLWQLIVALVKRELVKVSESWARFEKVYEYPW